LTPAALLGLVLALVVPAPTQSVVPQQAGAGRHLVVVSDSIAAGAERVMTAEFERRGWRVTFDAAVSRNTLEGASVVDSHRAHLDDTLLVSLGANDAGNPTTFRRRVEAVLESARGVRLVLWVSFHEVRDYYATANRVLREVAGETSTMMVLDWHSVASADPALTAADRLHLSPSGASAMTRLVGAAAWGEPSRAAPVPAPSTTPPSTAPMSPTGVPSSTGVPTTGAPTTAPSTAAPQVAAAVLAPVAASERPRRSRWRSLVNWTASGFALVMGVLAAAGMLLGAWSLWTTRLRSTHKS
jgi:hypothetical protein